MANKLETNSVRESVQKILNTVDEYLKAQDVMKKGFLASLSEELQTLDKLLQAADIPDEPKEE